MEATQVLQNQLNDTQNELKETKRKLETTETARKTAQDNYDAAKSELADNKKKIPTEGSLVIEADKADTTQKVLAYVEEQGGLEKLQKAHENGLTAMKTNATYEREKLITEHAKEDFNVKALVSHLPTDAQLQYSTVEVDGKSSKVSVVKLADKTEKPLSQWVKEQEEGPLDYINWRSTSKKSSDPTPEEPYTSRRNDSSATTNTDDWGKSADSFFSTSKPSN